MGVLLLLCCIIIFRVFYLREKAVILLMIGLLTLGCSAAIVIANLSLQLIESCNTNAFEFIKVLEQR